MSDKMMGFLSTNWSTVSSPQRYTAIIERCLETGFYIGYVPGFPGAHSQGASMEELNENLKEVIAMILEDGEPVMARDFVGTQVVEVA